MVDRLNQEQVAAVKTFYRKIAEVEGQNIQLDDSVYPLLTGSYKIIQKVGGGDPIKAAEWRLRAAGSIK
ncbi:MAG: hypothetical protein R2824_24065 [Saprospiraceae bacterium]|nr:hypothetical protein [Lewinella sp.]